MINTYNESDLHATLKKIYALEYKGKTEVSIGNWICDIETEDKSIIEIQTKNVSKLTPKVDDLLKQGRKVTVVHPLLEKKTIETYAADGSLLLRRQSPRQESIYSLPRELTGIYPLLTRTGFTLEVLFIHATELRQKADGPVQLTNRSRRFLKDWLPKGKRLDAILGKRRFSTLKDYKDLVPTAVRPPFTIPRLTKAITALPDIAKLNKSSRSYAEKQARLLIWLFSHMHILEECGKEGRSRLYKFCPGI